MEHRALWRFTVGHVCCGLIDCLETPMVNEFHEHVLGCKRRMDAIRLLGRRLEDETGA